ncbi:MAG: ABC transporter ATP-binding protein [Eubacteriales bacterium]|nr:ABC transporter ATP-binding protein/permease [Clostridiales bacterium]MDD6933314.1 ABC transporter ATP-binding protein [Eubacteriales bacterium]MDO4389390.1 ABC transporter ATP-binding protein [Eubacteriales bacterium]
MKKLLAYLKGYEKESILGPLFKLLEASFELIVPLVVAAMIDRGIGQGNKGYAGRMTLLLIALGLVGLVCSVTAQYFAAKASVGFVTRLRHALMEHLQKFTYAQLDKVGSSTLITRMTSDMNQVQTGMNLALRLLLRSPFVVFGAMIMAFFVDAKAAMVFVVAIPLLSVVVFGIMLLTIPLYKKVQARLDGVTGVTRENLSGVRVLRAFGKEEAEKAEFREKNQGLTTLQKKVGRVSSLMNPLTYAMINGAIVALIYQGALRVDAGALTQGQVVALYNYMSQILVELIKMANLIINMTKAAACGGRIQSILDMPAGAEKLDGGKEGGDCAVEFRNVCLKYPGAAEDSLTDLTFRVPRGQTVGVIGGTGSGKSSLVNLIPRFYDATGGQVLVNGRDVRAWEPQELRRRIGVVPQKAELFAGSIRDNLKWGDEDADDAALLAAAEAAQAGDVVRNKGGLDAWIEQHGRNLSGGQRQRLTIARALVRRPEILILDDSASALDYATDAALRSALAHLDWRPTVFIVSQRTSSIRHANLILVLEDGKVAGMGTHGELMENCPVYREIHESQFGKEDAE